MRILSLVVLSILSVSLSTQAQDRFIKAYYVSTKNDTIHGLIRYRDSYPQGISFKGDLKSPAQFLGVEEVKSFTFENGQTHELVNFADKNAPVNLSYAKKIGGDEISLYYSHGQFLMGSNEKSYFIIRKGKGSTSSEAMSRYQKNVGAFNILFNDCPEVKEKATKLAVSEELLQDRLEEYHACKSAPFKSYTPASRKRLHFGVFTGLSMSDLNLSGKEHLEGTTFNRSNKPLYGLMMTITPSRKASSVFSMQFELLYTSMQFEGTYAAEREAGGYNFKIISSTTVESQIIMPRFGFRLTGRSNVLNPYLSFGFAAPNISISESYDVLTVTINSGTETTESHDSIDIGSGGAWAGVGLKKGLSKERALFVDVTVNYMSTNDNGNVIMIAPRLGFMF
jgi:hypothetical protein